MILTLLIILLPMITTTKFPNCDQCPPQSTCELDSDGNARCLCNKGFTGDQCEIVLCDETSCFGPDSFCENTSQGPFCHCQEGREGSNCELLKGESHPWSTCSNATFCADSHNNGNCDEICNNPECIYDGNDCDQNSKISIDQYDTFQTSLLMVRVDLPPSKFFMERMEWLVKLSNFLNKTVTIAQQDGYDSVFIMDETGDRIMITEDESSYINSTSIEVDLTIDISECNFNLDECDNTFEQLYHSINDSIGSKDISSLHISFAAVTHPSPPPSSVFIPTILAISSILGLISIIGVAQLFARKRTRQVEADEFQLRTVETSHLPPAIKRLRPQPTASFNSNSLHFVATSPNVIQITNENLWMVKGCDSTGRTPLHALAALGRDEKSSDQITKDARFLIDNGAEVNSQDNEGNTALHLAVSNSRISIVKMLLDHNNIDVKITNNREQTAMHICASLSDIYSLDLLLKHPETKHTFEMTDLGHHTPLVINILHSSIDTTFAEKLLLAGAQVNYNGNEMQSDDDNCERSALHYAAEYGLLGHISLLIQYKAKVNAIDMMRMTPLHYAVKSNKIEAVHLLLKLGAEKGVHSHYNETPVHMARRMRHEEIVLHFDSHKQMTNLSSKNKNKRDTEKENEPIHHDFNDTGYQTASLFTDFEREIVHEEQSFTFMSNSANPTPSIASPPIYYHNSARDQTNYYPNLNQASSNLSHSTPSTTQSSSSAHVYNHQNTIVPTYPAPHQVNPQTTHSKLDPSQSQLSLPPLSS